MNGNGNDYLMKNDYLDYFLLFMEWNEMKFKMEMCD